MAKRRIADLKALSKTHSLDFEGENLNIFHVHLSGLNEEPWIGGIWKLRVELPKQYPYKSPSIGFVTKIWHPNVCFNSGTICLDVLNQEWSPIFNLECIVTKYLPLLLQNPNPNDPLNSEAADQLLNNEELFNETVRANINKYCNLENK